MDAVMRAEQRACADPLPLLSSEPSFLSGTSPTDSSSNVASSLSSTPPTSASPDNLSLASEQDTPKQTSASSMLLEGAIPFVSSLQDEPQVTEEPEPVHADDVEETLKFEQQELPEPQISEPQVVSSVHQSADPDVQLKREQQARPQTEHNDAQQIADTSAIVVVPRPSPLPESPSTAGRSRRPRASLPVYNLSKLAGTDIHGKRRAKGDNVRNRNRHTVSAADGIFNNGPAANSVETIDKELVGDAINASNLDSSVSGPATPKGANIARKNKSEPKKSVTQEPVTRRAARRSGASAPNTVTSTMTSIGKRGKKAIETGLSRMARELRRLQDTKEYAHIDERPIIETVWSKGKFVDPRTLEEPRPAKRAKTAHAPEPEAPAKDKAGSETLADSPPAPEEPPKKRTAKVWLDKGLYAGQPAPEDPTLGLTAQEKKKIASLPELLTSGRANNKILPAPMFKGLRLLIEGRHFKLPYDICNPLPPGQPKPAPYRSMTKNRFVGDAGAYWKKQPHLHDFQSKCVCKPEDGCAEDCQNRIMLYECDGTNCNVGKDFCSNRAFQSLQERTKQGGRYRTGVEVYKTGDRGYGVRSNRCFRPHQIIMEYTGEIITEEECERRMNEVYKDNECYYLMSFDQNMIIDATTGSIARFVNHSCSPNCRMIKWIVSGQPRMALFAGDRPIMTGEELTYDYNFDPFSAKNVQKCLCGAENCRGILGPKPREVKAPKVALGSSNQEGGKKSSVKATVKAGKRKLKEFMGGDADDIYNDVEGASLKSVKKRKIAVAKGAASLSKSGLKAAKGAASALKSRVSSMSINAKAALSSKSASTSSPRRRGSTGGIVKASAKKGSPGTKAKVAAAAAAKEKDNAKITTTKAAMAALISSGLPLKAVTSATAQASRSSSASLTIVAKGPNKSSASATSDGNAKNKVTKTKPAALKLKTPTKHSVSTPTKKGSAKQKHSGYTPPSSPKGGSAKKAAAAAAAAASLTSSRKKTPTHKIIESKKAGKASVTKTKVRGKVTKVTKIRAKTRIVNVTQGRPGFMAAVQSRLEEASGGSSAEPSIEVVSDVKKAQKPDDVAKQPKEQSPKALGSIEAAAPLIQLPAQQESSGAVDAVVAKPAVVPAVSSSAQAAKPGDGMDIPRAPHIRLVEPAEDGGSSGSRPGFSPAA